MMQYIGEGGLTDIRTRLATVEQSGESGGLTLTEVNTAIAAYLLANPVDAVTKQRVSYHNRFYFYADRRWVSAGDANFGFDDVNSSENSGTGTTPIIEWENQGIPLEAGDRIKSLQFRLRVNNLEPADVEFYVVFVSPDLATRWITGYDGDAEVTATVLHNDVHLGRTGAPLTANINDRTRQVIDLDFTCPSAGELRVFARPTGVPTATRYCYCNTIVDYEAA